jgi:hypothetical protein
MLSEVVIASSVTGPHLRGAVPEDLAHQRVLHAGRLVDARRGCEDGQAGRPAQQGAQVRRGDRGPQHEHEPAAGLHLGSQAHRVRHDAVEDQHIGLRRVVHQVEGGQLQRPAYGAGRAGVVDAQRSPRGRGHRAEEKDEEQHR